MKRINCIVVDDEPVAQDLMKKYITDVPALVLIQVCSNAFEAQEILMQHKIDLIFLDINMPGLSGMKFYKSLIKPPYVIFTTAYPEFAAEGFEVDAIDYLLKPFPFERFLKAVNKAIERIIKKEEKSIHEEYILLKADKKLHRINLSNISHLEAMGDYVKVFYSDTFIIVHDTLQKLSNQFPKNEFVRIHKSYVVSKSYISYIEGNQVKLGDKEIPIGKSYREELFNDLK